MKKQVKDKRKAIMEAALKLFTERGFHGTSTAQISKEAGVATGTPFNYFSSKEDLVNSLYSEVKSRLSSCIKEGIDIEATSQDKIKKLWSNFIIFGVNNPEEFLFIEQFCSSPDITKFTREEVMKDYTFIFDLMEDFKKEYHRHVPTELVLMIFYNSTRAVVSFILDSKTSKDEEKIIEDGFQILWKGLAG